MRVKLQLVMCTDDGQEETVTDIVTLQKDSQRIEHLGLTLREAKQLLNTIQKHLLQHQVAAFLLRAQPVQTAALSSKPKAIIPARSAPCLGPSSSPVHVSSIAAAGVVRRPRSAR